MKTAVASFLKLAVLACHLVLLPNLLSAQQTGWLGQLSKEDSAAINALVLYPDTVRLSILEAAKYPEAIVRTALLQKKTSADFANAISSFSREEQEVFWDLTRYPDLIDKLVEGGKKTTKTATAIAAEYPEEIRETAITYGTKQYDVLKIISEQQNKSNLAFNDILKIYPPAAQQVLKELVYLPEVLSILNDHLQMTVLMGDMYSRNPQWVIQTIDSLSLVVARQNASELEDWKKSIEQDTTLQSELKQVASAYAADNGNQSIDYSNPPPENYLENYMCYPYSYWFGYPHWYPYYYWYPYPYWYDWGFYYNPYGSFVVFGMPSFYFTYWYFYHPNYYYDYPYVCNAYVNHYYGPRGGASENAGVVRDWVQENSTYLPKDFVSASEEVRVNAIRQLGKFEMDWKQQNAVSPISRTEFLNKNRASYPQLNVRKPEVKTDSRQPAVVVPEKVAPARQPAARMPAQKSTETKSIGNLPIKFDFNKVQPAQEYHKSTWDRTQPSISKPERNPMPSAPAIKQAPPRTKPR